MRRCLCLSVVALSWGCFNPEPPEGEGLETESSGTETGSASETVGDPSGPGTDTTDPTTSGSETEGETDDPSTTEGADPVCGDGEVQGDEVCDDGVNDGGYGGCSADCSALGPFCGDGEVQGDEACDDEVNDGSYGGCNDDCSLAGFCGDGNVDGDDELCDEGGANENGAGCNVDCTTSGTLLFENLQTGFTFCDGAFATPARFDAAGSGHVSASGYCGGDTQLMQAFSPELEVFENFDVLLADTPLRQATMVDDKWVLSGGSCSYAIEGGMFTEVCADGRLTGLSSLASVGAPGFAALDFGSRLGLYGPMSPMMGDMPEWEATPPAPGFYEYFWNRAARGPNNSILVAGRRLQENNGDEVGLLLQYTAAGNQADTNTYGAVDQFNEIATGPDTTLLFSYINFGEPGYPGGYITMLNAAFGVAWSLQVPDPGAVQLAVDSEGTPIVLIEDGNGNGAYELRKLDRSDGSTNWSVGLPEANNDARISVGPDDYIWVTAAGYGPEGGQLWVGRVSP